MLERNNRILMATCRGCGNKWPFPIVAKEIELIRKDMNKDRWYMAEILSENFQNKKEDYELRMWILFLIYASRREISAELPVTNILDLAITYLSFTLALEGITQVRNFLYHYLNISPYPFQTTSFKINEFCIPEVFYVSGAKG